MKTLKVTLVGMLAAVMLLLSACGANTNNTSGGNAAKPDDSSNTATDDTAAANADADVSKTPGAGGKAIGFIFIGTRDDHGYNQAAYLGSEAVEKAFPDKKILRVENVPENAQAERVMEEMIRAGAKIIFATSYGHLEPALNVAKRYPDVVFFHQGGQKTADNLNTYFGNIYESLYLAGVAAGKMTKTGKLGFIAPIPIPGVLQNVNAFTLGAQSVNPKVTTNVVFTGQWCDPTAQANAANSLIDQGADVLTQHQDCSKTLMETAERRGVMTVGFHADASDIAPNGWITGAVWNWGKLMVDMVKAADSGKLDSSPYKGQYLGNLKDGTVELAPYGKNVPDDVKQLVEQKKTELIAGTLQPFAGPIKDQAGKIRVAEGAVATMGEISSTDYLVQGVVGTIPK